MNDNIHAVDIKQSIIDARNSTSGEEKKIFTEALLGKLRYALKMRENILIVLRRFLFLINFSSS